MHETPEAAVAAFAEAWKRRRWAAMLEACQTHRRVTGRVTVDRLRDLFGHWRLRSYEVGARVAVSDAAIANMTSGRRLPLSPEAVDVELRIRYDVGPGVMSGVRTVRVIREDENGMPMLSPEGGSWGINETSALRGITPSR